MFPKNKLAELAATSFFAALNTATLNELLIELELIHLPGGEILFRAGDDGDSLYVVLSGRLRVYINGSDGGTEMTRELSRGDSVGELALLTGERRSATIRAIRDTELAMLSRVAFERVIQSDPALIRQIAAQLAARQRRGSDGGSRRGKVRTVAILPAHRDDEANGFTDLLVNALNQTGSTLRVSRETVKNVYGLEFTDTTKVHAGEKPLTVYLDELETNHRLVVYQADSELTPWTKCCIRQADLILLLIRAVGGTANAQLEPIQEYFAARAITAGVELVLLHERKFNPNTVPPKWLGISPASHHHHVLLNEPADSARLARLITGDAVGLVLSGGGARGFAHIGVIRAFHERRIPIDYIGGTSMGAVIAAQHALGWDWQTMARVNRDEWPRCEPQKNYTLPLVALNSARRMDHMLRRMFGTVDIENLRSPFFCVSTNLTTATAKIHCKGLLWKAVRASLSIPGIGPPAIENGEILVDGGLVDNLPVETMKQFCQGPVYAVDVSEQVEFTSRLSESYTVSGWKLLWQQLNPFGEKPDIPNILNTLYRTTTVGGIRANEIAKSQADLCFEPPIGQFGVFEWRHVEEIIEIGYRHAIEKLDERASFAKLTENVQSKVT
jgi:NTE family protein